MSDAAPEAEPRAPDDPCVLRAERRLALLQELGDIGMRLARELERRVLAGEDGAAPAGADAEKAAARGRDPADAFSRLSRAIRLTIALEAKADEALRNLAAGVTQAREEKALAAAQQERDAAAARRRHRMHDVEFNVIQAAEAELESEHVEDVCRELDRWGHTGEDPRYDPDRPLRDAIEDLCQFFRLSPDWSQWDGEAFCPDQPPWPWELARKAAEPLAPHDETQAGPNGAAAHIPAHDLE